MGSFEKLGILVIVVIIVMILAVAIYQWGGTGIPGMGSGSPAFESGVLPLVVTPPFRPEDPEEVFYLDRQRKLELERRELESKKLTENGGSSADLKSKDSAEEWDGGIPRVYKVRKGDILWNVVVKRWKLKESFCAAIARANPKVRMTRLGAGRRLEIPNPQAYFSGGKPVQRGTRRYEVQVGDRLETISRAHLGKKSRWREILGVNPGLDPKKIRPGQRIRLPAR